MSETTEQEDTLLLSSNQKITRVEIIDNGHGIKYYTVPESKSEEMWPQYGTKESEEVFPIIPIILISVAMMASVFLHLMCEYLSL